MENLHLFHLPGNENTNINFTIFETYVPSASNITHFIFSDPDACKDPDLFSFPGHFLKKAAQESIQKTSDFSLSSNCKHIYP